MSAALAFDRLHLTVSASLAAEALELARRRHGSHSPLSCLPATLLAQVGYEQGRLAEAEALLRPRWSVIRACGMAECVVRASTLLARASLHRGQHASALAVLRDAITLGRSRRWSRLLSVASSEHARALQAIRHRAERSLESWPLPNREAADARQDHVESPTVGDARRCMALSGKTVEVRLLMARCRLGGLPPNGPAKFSSIETALERACGQAAEGRIDDSYNLLIKCLRSGAAHGLRMIFVDAAPQISNLLADLYRTIPPNHPDLADLRPYIVTILRSGTQAEHKESPTTAYRSLSRREAGVLQMIARGMSNKCIARSLGITPETVKTHAKSIFSKLDTRTRAQAVARAESIGLL